MKVLVQAYACSPDWGSEQGVGWNYVLMLSKKCDVHVLVKEKYKESITTYIDREPNEHLHFYFLAHNSLEMLLMKRVLTYYIGYTLWQKRAYDWAIQLHSIHHFNLTHVLTYIGFRTPGYFYKLPIPCVWGPIGGAQNYPWNCLGGLTIAGMIKEANRNIINVVQKKFSIHYLQASKKSKIVTATKKTGEFLNLCNVTSIPVTGCKQVDIDVVPKSFSVNTPLNILWSGSHVELKRLDILIRALRNVNFEFKLTVLGGGHLTEYWKRLAKRCGLIDNVSFTGKIPHVDAMKMFRESDIFVFTSLRETSATVVLESLSRGVPVIAMDINGAHDLIDETCGYRIPVVNNNQMIGDLRKLLHYLAQNKGVLFSKSIGALKRAHCYTWEKNSEKILEIYEVCIGKPV